MLSAAEALQNIHLHTMTKYWRDPDFSDHVRLRSCGDISCVVGVVYSEWDVEREQECTL